MVIVDEICMQIAEQDINNGLLQDIDIFPGVHDVEDTLQQQDVVMFDENGTLLESHTETDSRQTVQKKKVRTCSVTRVRNEVPFVT